jgi:hypothetical protein
MLGMIGGESRHMEYFSNFLKRVWAWVKTGWGAIGFLGMLQMVAGRIPAIWRRISDIDTAKDVWQAFGGDLPMLISLVSHPLFGLALIIIGLIGIPAATKNQDGRNEHSVWLFLGWAVFGIVIVVLLVAMLGDRLSRSDLLTNAGEYYIKSHSLRELTESQKNGIKNIVCPLSSKIGTIAVLTIDDPEAHQYATQISVAMAACMTIYNPYHPKKPTVPMQVYQENPRENGVYIVVVDREHPDYKSSLLHDAMNDAGIVVKYTEWDDIPMISMPAISVHKQ